MKVPAVPPALLTGLVRLCLGVTYLQSIIDAGEIPVSLSFRSIHQGVRKTHIALHVRSPEPLAEELPHLASIVGYRRNDFLRLFWIPDINFAFHERPTLIRDLYKSPGTMIHPLLSPVNFLLSDSAKGCDLPTRQQSQFSDQLTWRGPKRRSRLWTGDQLVTLQ